MVVALDAGGLGWLHMYAHRNYWKVKHIYDDVHDLIQDGHMCWGIVANKYTHCGDLIVDNRLMSLFKMTFVNHIREVAAKEKDRKRDFFHMKRNLEDMVDRDVPEKRQNVLDRLYARVNAGDLYNDPGVVLTIVEAAEPIRSVLKFLVSDEGIRTMQRPFRRKLDGSRETVNARICRSIGRSYDVDLMSMTKQYLLEAI